jgi:hypothetical protein
VLTDGEHSLFDPGRVYTAPEVAEKLRLSPSSVLARARRGAMPCLRFGPMRVQRVSVRFLGDDLNAWEPRLVLPVCHDHGAGRCTGLCPGPPLNGRRQELGTVLVAIEEDRDGRAVGLHEGEPHGSPKRSRRARRDASDAGAIRVAPSCQSTIRRCWSSIHSASSTSGLCVATTTWLRRLAWQGRSRIAPRAPG